MVVRATVKRVGKVRRVKTQGAQEASHARTLTRARLSISRK